MSGTATLVPIKDNSLYAEAPDRRSKGAGAFIFTGKNNRGEARRALISFDIAGNIPTGAVIDSTTLTLHLSRTSAGPELVELHRLLADWGEGTSDASANEGGGTTATAGDATWKHRFFDSSVWESPGGDHQPEASANAEVVSPGFYTWESTALMVADVQGWLDDSSTNFGWIVIGNESKRQTTKRFDSRENRDEENRPALVIEYTVK